jgi:hypothetical protein
MIAMALIINNRMMKKSETLDWIETTFKHYRRTLDDGPGNLLSDSDSASDSDDDEARAQASKHLPAFNVIRTAFGRFEISAVTPSLGEWTLCINEARIYVQQKFGPTPNGTFPFLRLPAEIRGVIYDMVFQYPRSGLLVLPHPTEGTPLVRILTKTLSAPFSKATWFNTSHWSQSGFYTLTIKHLLSLLLVNKQIFTEAFPCFYPIISFTSRLPVEHTGS